MAMENANRNRHAEMTGFRGRLKNAQSHVPRHPFLALRTAPPSPALFLLSILGFATEYTTSSGSSRDIRQADRQNAALHQIVIAIRNCLNRPGGRCRARKKIVSVTMAPASSAANCRRVGDHRNHCVAQGMAVDDGALGQAFARAVRM